MNNNKTFGEHNDIVMLLKWEKNQEKSFWALYKLWLATMLRSLKRDEINNS